MAIQPVSSSATLAHFNNSTVCLSHSTGSWVLDSGASDHVAGYPSLISNLSPPKIPHNITVANGPKAQVTGIGQASPLPSLSLNYVLFVPGSPFNLISISKLPQSLNCSITFSSDSFLIQDRSTGKIIGTGSESQGLYYLHSHPSTICGVSASPDIIHRRLGHPSLDKLKVLVPHLLHLKSLDCESCQLGKHVRVSFPSCANKRSMSPFDIIHSDVWGPSRVSSTLGYKYYVTFIDDFSRCTWITLLKDRSELFGAFQTFCSEIKTQFGKTIRILQSDNAKEYFSTSFNSFLVSHGIIHQSSCPHTPQQNDAILTACYLINHMPSSVLGNEIPYSLLFPKDPLYAIPLRVFGSTCFVHDLSPGRDKLSARAVKCVFLGYSKTQKGYRCYSPSAHRFYVSADVTFFEDKSFFASSTTSGSTTSTSDVTTSQVMPIPLFEPFVSTQNPPESQGNDEFRQYGITYERRHAEAPETALIDSNDSTPKTPATNSSDSGTVTVSSPTAVPLERPID